MKTITLTLEVKVPDGIEASKVATILDNLIDVGHSVITDSDAEPSEDKEIAKSLEIGNFTVEESLEDFAVPRIYIYNENCVMGGEVVPLTELSKYDDPEEGTDWTGYDVTEENAKSLEAHGGFWSKVASKVRAALNK